MLWRKGPTLLHNVNSKMFSQCATHNEFSAEVYSVLGIKVPGKRRLMVLAVCFSIFSPHHFAGWSSAYDLCDHAGSLLPPFTGQVLYIVFWAICDNFSKSRYQPQFWTAPFIVGHRPPNEQNLIAEFSLLEKPSSVFPMLCFIHKCLLSSSAPQL